MSELEQAQEILRNMRPSWAKDGSASAPAGPPQMPLPPPRRALLDVLPTEGGASQSQPSGPALQTTSVYVTLAENQTFALAKADVPLTVTEYVTGFSA